ncbi:MAG: 2'-5' RNA ligase family protein [Thermoplasmatota archaeon]
MADKKPLPSRELILDLVPLRATADAGQDLDLLASKYGAVDEDDFGELAAKPDQPTKPAKRQNLDALAEKYGAYEPPQERTLDETGRLRDVDPFGNLVPRSFRSSAPTSTTQPTPGRRPMPPRPEPIDVSTIPKSMADLDDEYVQRVMMAGEGVTTVPPEDTVTGPARLAGDVITTAVKGAVGIPEAVVGLADIPTGGRVGKRLEDVGFRPGEAGDILESWYSDHLKGGKKEVADADGLLETAVKALSNPEVVFHAVLESLPVMLAGGAAGRVLPGGKALSAAWRGSIGEGAMAAGSAAESTRQQNDDRLLSRTQGALAVATGASTTLLGRLGNGIATKLGLDDIDTLLAASSFDPIAKSSLAQAVARGVMGAGQEGLLEEFPQSVVEQWLSNAATGKPLMQGVDEAAVLGALSGGVMGFAANIQPIQRQDDDGALATDPQRPYGSILGRLDAGGGPAVDVAPAPPPPGPVAPEPPQAPMATLGDENAPEEPPAADAPPALDVEAMLAEADQLDAESDAQTSAGTVNTPPRAVDNQESTAARKAAFEKTYRDALTQSLKYSPDQAGSRVWAERLGEMTDAHPEWTAEIDAAIENERPTKEPSIEVIDDDEGVTENASGESAASAEAISRLNSVKAAGEEFGKYDRAGRWTPLMTADALADYHPFEGETTGYRGPDGFRMQEANGGKVPPRPAQILKAVKQGPSPLDEFEAAGKEPWQVTRAEWVELMRSHRRHLGQDENGGTSYAPNADYEQYHRMAVRDAVAAGRDVPQRVRDDYREAPDAAPISEADTPPREFSSTQVPLPAKYADRIKALADQIPDEDLAEDGREDEPHITVQYGIESDDAEPLRQILSRQRPITVKVGDLSLFENDDADVVIAKIDGAGLHRVRDAIRTATNDAPGDTRGDYKPHATIAYVKPGKGKATLARLRQQWATGDVFTLTEITFSTRDRQTITIPLAGSVGAEPKSNADLTDEEMAAEVKRRLEARNRATQAAQAKKTPSDEAMERIAAEDEAERAKAPEAETPANPVTGENEVRPKATILRAIRSLETDIEDDQRAGRGHSSKKASLANHYKELEAHPEVTSEELNAIPGQRSAAPPAKPKKARSTRPPFEKKVDSLGGFTVNDKVDYRGDMHYVVGFRDGRVVLAAAQTGPNAPDGAGLGTRGMSFTAGPDDIKPWMPRAAFKVGDRVTVAGEGTGKIGQIVGERALVTTDAGKMLPWANFTRLTHAKAKPVTPQVPALGGMTPLGAKADAPAVDPKRAALDAKRAELKEEIAAAAAAVRAELKKAGNTLSSGLPVPSDALILQTVKLVRLYAKAGIVEAASGWEYFKDDIGDLAQQAKAAFKIAWSMVHDVAEPELEDGDEQKSTGRPDAGDGPLEDERAPEPDRDATDDDRTADDRGVGGDRPEGDVGTEEGGEAGTDRTEPGVAKPDAGGKRGGRRAGRGSGGRTDARRPATPARSDDTHGPRVDFVISSADELTQGGVKSKLADNLAAIRLLLQLRKESRRATGEEQQTLARYVGWGATDLSKVVDRRDDTDLSHDAVLDAARAELKGLLTKDEFESLSRSVTNAHYTFFETPTVMWAAVRHLGFRGGRVLEPSVGSGHFFGTMPADLRDASHRTGVELDMLSAELTGHMYQGAQIINAGFQVAPIADNSIDLAISNVPFGDYKVSDPAYQGRKAHLAGSIHNYFFVKALDKVRPGGLIAFVTSRQTMDAPTHKGVREHLTNGANFLGAVRLPDRSFKSTAGTEVVTDIIFLQKREAGESPTEAQSALNDSFVSTEPVRIDGLRFSRSSYYSDAPGQVLGVERATGKLNQRGDDYNVEVDPSRSDIAAAMSKALTAALPRDAYTPAAERTETDTADIRMARADAKHGELIDEDGKLYENERGVLKALDVSPKQAKRIRGFIAIKLAYRALLDSNLDTSLTDAERAKRLSRDQKALKGHYKTFVDAYGPVNTVYNRSQFKGDPESPRVFSLENIQWVTEKQPNGKGKRVLRVVSLADIFEKRVAHQVAEPTTAASSKDALVLSLAWRGRVDIDHMAALTGATSESVIDELDETDIFFDPTSQTWVTRDEYLSGDVVSKLEAAKGSGLKFSGHVTALEAVQPKRIEAKEIDARVGATFIEPSYIKAFLAHILGVKTDAMKVEKHQGAERLQWTLDAGGAYEARSANDRHELYVGAYGGPIEMLNDLANLGMPQVYTGDRDNRVFDPVRTTQARENMRRLEEMWREWWPQQDELATEIVEQYNAVFNRTALRVFDGSHLSLPGSNPAVKLRTWQKNVVWRILQKGNTLMAHVVGAGKTYAMIAAAMEMRRLGLANKPMIAIPNHMIGQFTRDFYKLYPGAKLLVTSKGDLSKSNRADFTARITSGDWDTVVMTHDQYKAIGVHPDTYRTFVDEQLKDLERMHAAAEAAGDRRTAKQHEKAIQRLKERLADRTRLWEKDKAVTFEELGIDALFVDEAHLFKNLYFTTGMTRVAGLNQSESQRAVDMFLKVRWLSKKTGGRNVVFATGTPIANAVSELFTMMRYLSMDRLADLGLDAFDAWVQQFADRVAKDEPAPEGGFRERIRLRRYTNAPELVTMFREFADVVMPEDIPDLKRPKIRGGSATIVVNEASPLLSVIKGYWAERVQAIRSGDVEPDEDNMLKITSEAAAAAVDIRLVVPTAPEERNSRLHQVTANMVEVYERTKADKGTQIAFLDIGTPKNAPPLSLMTEIDLTDQEKSAKDDSEDADESVDGEGNAIPTFDGRDLYADLKAKLVKAGIPANEIAFVHSAKTDVQKQLLFEAVNDGRIRILIGSTGKMGVGTNVQKRLVALHHIDVPWRPADLEQREGRILRQGNDLHDRDGDAFEVDIFRYVTKDSFDEYRWGLLAIKQAFISQLIRGKSGVREFTDVDPAQLDFEEASEAAGDPRRSDLRNAENAREKLELRRRSHEDKRNEARWRIPSEEAAIARSEAMIARYTTLRDQLTDWLADPNRVVSLGGVEYRVEAGQDGRKDLAAKFREYVKAANKGLQNGDSDSNEVVGKIGPLTIRLHATSNRSTTKYYPPRQGQSTTELYRKVGFSLMVDGVAVDSTADYREKEYTHFGESLEVEKDEMPDFLRSMEAVTRPAVMQNRVDSYERAKESAEAALKDYTALAAREFPDMDRFEPLDAKIKELKEAINADAAKATPPAADGETPAADARIPAGVDVSHIKKPKRAEKKDGPELTTDRDATKWTKGAYEVATNAGKVAVKGDMFGHFGVRKVGDEWQLDHLPTGLNFAKFGLKANAKGVAEELMSGGVDFSFDTAEGMTDEAKKAGREAIKRAGQPKTAPSGDASVDIFVEDKPLAPSTSVGGALNLWTPAGQVAPRATAIEMPEMVAFATELSQTPRVVRGFRSLETRGLFQGGTISLRADFFKPEHRQQLARLLAHEIGHLLDWLPDMDMRRGNILGRLQSLHRFMKWKYTAADGTTVKLGVIRDELTALSAYWRPWPTDYTTKYENYRKRSRELYADAISALLNDPERVKTMAPTFFKEFFSELDNKPEVKRAYFDLMDALTGTRAELIERRRGSVREMFDYGNAKALDLVALKIRERETQDYSVMERLRIQHVDRNTALNDRVDAWEKEHGRKVAAHEDPRLMLEDNPHVGGGVKGFAKKFFEPVYAALNKAGVDWTTFGEILFYERIVAGDRSDVANPKGLDDSAAQEMLTAALATLTPDQRRVARVQADAFRDALKEVAERAYKAGLYTEELYEQMQKNPAYVTFRVLEHLDETVTSTVYRQVGTLKDIQHPAEASIVKAVVTLKAAEYNRIKRDTFKWFDENTPGEFETAPTRWMGKKRGWVPQEPKDSRTRKLVTYKVAGKLVGKHVDPYVAVAFERMGPDELGVVLSGLNLVTSKYLRPVFTTMNPGFMTFNFVRDFLRFWKNFKGMTLRRAMRRYVEATPMAFVRAFPSKPGQNISAWRRKAEAALNEAENAKILDLTLSEVLGADNLEDTNIDQILADVGVSTYAATRGKMRRVLGWLEAAGDFIETLPKAAALIDLTSDGRSISELDAAERSLVRRWIGSPDFLQRGSKTRQSNTLFLFSNAIIQGTRADIEIALDPNTAGGWWFKTAAINIAPKVLMFALPFLAARAGDDDDEDGPLALVARIMAGVSEYDKTNYLIVPLGLDDNGESIYLRVPQDDTGRLVGGLAWKALGMMAGDKDAVKSLMQAFDFTAGQVPGANPIIRAVTADVPALLAGVNVYDPFRSRMLFTPDELAAMDRHTFKKFVGYEFQQLGGGIVWRFTPGQERPIEKSAAQKFLDFPVVSNVVGRWIRIGDRGRVEGLRDSTGEVRQDEARTRLNEKDLVSDAIRVLQKTAPPNRRRVTAERASAIMKEVYPDLDQRAASTKKRAIEKKLGFGVVRGSADPYIEVLMSSTSNQQKVAVVKRAKKDLTPPKFQSWLRRGIDEGVISKAVVEAARKEP